MIDLKVVGVFTGGLAAVAGLSILASRRRSGSLAEEGGKQIDTTDYNALVRDRIKDFELVTFDTSIGSTYQVLDNRQAVAVRVAASTKQIKPGFTDKPGDRHAGKPSLITYYVKPSDAKRLGQHSLIQKDKNVVIMMTHGVMVPLIENKSTGGMLAPLYDAENPIPFSTYPMIGLCPVELWDEAFHKNKPFYRSWHTGGSIVNVRKSSTPSLK